MRFYLINDELSEPGGWKPQPGDMMILDDGAKLNVSWPPDGQVRWPQTLASWIEFRTLKDSTPILVISVSHNIPSYIDVIMLSNGHMWWTRRQLPETELDH
jgi:hypothetical protein